MEQMNYEKAFKVFRVFKSHQQTRHTKQMFFLDDKNKAGTVGCLLFLR